VCVCVCVKCEIYDAHTKPLPRDAMLGRYDAVVVSLVCLSDCLSVCPPHADIVSKRLHV